MTRIHADIRYSKSIRSRISTSLILAVLLIISSFPSFTCAICPLCATVADFPTKWDVPSPDGRTCTEVYLSLAEIGPNNPRCQATKDVAQEFCCEEVAEDSEGSNSVTVDDPVVTIDNPEGDEPVCPICGTTEFPGIPNAFLQIRYVGQYFCSELYERGLNGQIPDFMCGPVQDYAISACGCGSFNPRCIEDPSQCFNAVPGEGQNVETEEEKEEEVPEQRTEEPTPARTSAPVRPPPPTRSPTIPTPSPTLEVNSESNGNTEDNDGTDEMVNNSDNDANNANADPEESATNSPTSTTTDDFPVSMDSPTDESPVSATDAPTMAIDEEEENEDEDGRDPASGVETDNDTDSVSAPAPAPPSKKAVDPSSKSQKLSKKEKGGGNSRRRHLRQQKKSPML